MKSFTTPTLNRKIVRATLVYDVVEKQEALLPRRAQRVRRA